MNKLIILGTSHLTDEHNCIKRWLSNILHLEAYNYSISSLGIDTYFPRLLSILKEHKDKKLNFLLELPCHGRYEECLSNDYNNWAMLETNFWHNNYQQHISYYNVAKLNNPKFKKYIIDKQVTSSVLKLKTLSNKRVEEEQGFAKAVVIDGFLKNLGHTVTWVTLNNYTLTDNPLEFADFNVVTKKPFFQIIVEKHGYKSMKEFRNSDKEMHKKLFPDGSHLNLAEWHSLIKEYIVPYFESVSTGS